MDLNCSFLYNTAKASFDDPRFSSALTGDPKLDYVYTPDGGVTTPFGTEALYSASYLNNLGDYSDLEYDRIELSVGGTLEITKNISTNVTLFYDRFLDDEPYVNEDQDGDVAGGMATVMYKF